jgi:hypothetical protein
MARTKTMASIDAKIAKAQAAIDKSGKSYEDVLTFIKEGKC